MANTDADICNLALARIGELKTVTSPLSGDTSTEGKACNVLYAPARDLLLARMRWRFASAAKWLYEDGLINPYLEPPTYGVPGFEYTYALPSDCIEPRWVFGGVRQDQGAWPLSIEQMLFITAVAQLPAINGVPPQIPFEVDGSLLFTDFTDINSAPAWDANALGYAVGTVVTYLGQAYVALQTFSLINPTPGTQAASGYWGVTNSCLLVYTKQVTDVTKMPALFVEALAWRLAVDLAMPLTGKPELAAALDKKAETALVSAMTVEANARQPDPRNDASWIAGRM